MGLIRRLVVLAFAVIQLILVARILLDIGVIPADWATIADFVVPFSDALAAPVEGLGGMFGAGFPGGAGLGQGLNPVMIGALAGWTIVEGLVLGVVSKFAAV
jgi:hypothetical protein